MIDFLGVTSQKHTNGQFNWPAALGGLIFLLTLSVPIRIYSQFIE